MKGKEFIEKLEKQKDKNKVVINKDSTVVEDEMDI